MLVFGKQSRGQGTCRVTGHVYTHIQDEMVKQRIWVLTQISGILFPSDTALPPQDEYHTHGLPQLGNKISAKRKCPSHRALIGWLRLSPTCIPKTYLFGKSTQHAASPLLLAPIHRAQLVHREISRSLWHICRLAPIDYSLVSYYRSPGATSSNIFLRNFLVCQ